MFHYLRIKMNMTILSISDEFLMSLVKQNVPQDRSRRVKNQFKMNLYKINDEEQKEKIPKKQTIVRQSKIIVKLRSKNKLLMKANSSLSKNFLNHADFKDCIKTFILR